MSIPSGMTLSSDDSIECNDGLATCWGIAETSKKSADGDEDFMLRISKRTNPVDPEVAADVGQCHLDSRAVLKAFRLIGSYAGIHIEELRQTIATVHSEHVRKPLLRNLDEIFSKFDHDSDGIIDVIEFERMVKSSTILQAAVYDILAAVDDEERASRAREIPIYGEYVELASLSLVLLNFVSAAISLDNSPEWQGWHFIELAFVCLFSIDLGIRFARIPGSTRRSINVAHDNNGFLRTLTLGPSLLRTMTPSQSMQAARSGSRSLRYQYTYWCIKTQSFFSSPLHITDTVATVVGWIEVCDHFVNADTFSQQLFLSVQLLRWIRLLRLLRLVRTISHFRDLGTVLLGILSGARVVLWGLSGITVIVLMWAIIIRQDLVDQQDYDDKIILREIFPNVPRTMHVLYRCMVMQSDGSCESNHGPMVALLAARMGGAFDVAWLLSEFFVLFVLCNVMTAIFVCQAAENAKQLQESIYHSLWQEDEERLQSLDKLLRTLIYPGRGKEQTNPKDRYAAQVASMIQNEHPEAAAKMPNLEREVVNFARGIEDSKKLLQNAMNSYEAKEVTPCRDLQNTPSAKMYMLDGEEVLLVDKSDASISNALTIPPAPMSAVEVILVQELDNLSDLMEEAKEVQEFVKSKIFPQSAWAATAAAGSSGDIRKNSNRLCDEALDPGLKSEFRIQQKVSMKYNGRYQRNRDYCRLGLVYDSVKHLMQALPLFLSFRLESEGMEVVSIENRFVHPHPLGWRDITILLRVSVPSTGSRHIMELQMMLRGLKECRNENHRFYEEIRGLLPEDALMKILDRLVTDTTLELGITSAEWLQCLHNKEVRKLLDALGVPSICRKRLFDLVDIDDSGTVASSELQEMLRLYRSPTQALELAGCHLRVREVQRHAQTKLSPQLNKLHKHVLSMGSMLDDLLRDLVQHFQQMSRGHRPKTQLKMANRSSQEINDSLIDGKPQKEYLASQSFVDVLNAWMEEHRHNQMNELEQSFEHLQKKLTRDMGRTPRGDLAKRALVKLPCAPHPSTAKSAVG